MLKRVVHLKANENFISGFISGYKERLKKGVDSLDERKIAEVIRLIIAAGNDGRQIFIAGNGGSASTASHMACDLSKTVLSSQSDNERLRVISLSDNIPSI